MSAAVYAAVARVLRSSEHLKARVLEAPLSADGRQCAAEVTTVGHWPRLLAVVVNVETGDCEEGLLIVLSRPSSPVIEACLPIYASFRIALEQSPVPAELDADGRPRPSRQSHLVASVADGPALVTTFSNEQDASVSVVASSVDDLSDIVKETQRLAALARLHGFAPGSSHGFAAFYRPLAARDKRRSGSVSAAHAHLISRPIERLRAGKLRPGEDHSPASALNVESIRAGWIARQLQSRVDEYTADEPLRVLVASYNVNDKVPSGADFRPWLQPKLEADLVVVGLQELDMSADALLRFSPARQTAWSSALGAALGSSYTQLAAQQFASLGSWAFAHRRLIERVGTVDVQSHGLGVGALGAGNKGATALRCVVGGSVLTFVNVHLAAFAENTARRNTDMADVFRRLAFPLSAPVDPRQLSPRRPHSLRPEVLATGPDVAHAFEADALFVSGDLNYRIEAAEGDDALVKARSWSELLKRDQLAREREAGRVLQDFAEGEIEHAPTYKYDVGHDTFDSSEKARAPAWTDRVLWLSEGERVRQLSLRSHAELRMSDHKPISSLFEVKVRIEVADQRRRVLDDVHRQLDAFENDAVASAVIEPAPALEFASVEFGRAVSQTFRLRNTGSTAAEFAFVPKPGGGDTIVQPWLWLSPTSGLVLPRESETITATILVDGSTAGPFNLGQAELSDLAILRLTGGRDLFLSITAREYQRSTFGTPLEQLVLLDRPIRSYAPAELESAVATPPPSSTATVSVPAAITRLTDWLTAHAMETDGLFVSAVEAEHTERIRDALDTGAEFTLQGSHTRSSASQAAHTELKLSLSMRDLDLADDATLLQTTDDSPRHSERTLALAVANCLLGLLHALPEPVVALYSRAIEAETRDQVYAVIAALPRVHAATLTHVCAFVRAVTLVHGEEPTAAGDARLDRLAVVFGNALMRAPPGISVAGQPMRRKRFVRTLLVE